MLYQFKKLTHEARSLDDFVLGFGGHTLENWGGLNPPFQKLGVCPPRLRRPCRRKLLVDLPVYRWRWRHTSAEFLFKQLWINTFQIQLLPGGGSATHKVEVTERDSTCKCKRVHSMD